MTSFYDLVRARIGRMDDSKIVTEGDRAELETLKLFAEKSYLRDNYIEGMKNAIKFLEEIK